MAPLITSWSPNQLSPIFFVCGYALTHKLCSGPSDNGFLCRIEGTKGSPNRAGFELWQENTLVSAISISILPGCGVLKPLRRFPFGRVPLEVSLLEVSLWNFALVFLCGVFLSDFFFIIFPLEISPIALWILYWNSLIGILL